MKNTVFDMMPELELDSKKFPQIKGWEVGKEYELELKVKMTRKSQGGYDRPDSLISGSFKILTAMNDSDEKEVEPVEKKANPKIQEKKIVSKGSFMRAAAK